MEYFDIIIIILCILFLLFQPHNVIITDKNQQLYDVINNGP